MEMIPAPRTSPAELTVETVREWTLELTDVERGLGHGFPAGTRVSCGGVSAGLAQSGGAQKRLAVGGSQRR